MRVSRLCDVSPTDRRTSLLLSEFLLMAADFHWLFPSLLWRRFFVHEARLWTVFDPLPRLFFPCSLQLLPARISRCADTSVLAPLFVAFFCRQFPAALTFVWTGCSTSPRIFFPCHLYAVLFATDFFGLKVTVPHNLRGRATPLHELAQRSLLTIPPFFFFARRPFPRPTPIFDAIAVDFPFFLPKIFLGARCAAIFPCCVFGARLVPSFANRTAFLARDLLLLSSPSDLGDAFPRFPPTSSSSPFVRV